MATANTLKLATHPVWLRITHWLNAVAVLVLVTSGWRIYNASPFFPFEFPRAHHAGRLARRRAAVALRGDVAAGRPTASSTWR